MSFKGRALQPFQWLFRFLDAFPKVPPWRIYLAIEMVGIIYDAFGFELPKRLEAVRLKKEGMAKKFFRQ